MTIVTSTSDCAVFAQTSVSKHYYAARKVREGDVYFGFKAEIKGVWLKSSNLPGNLTDDASDAMDSILATSLSGEPIDLPQYVKRVADIEREIVRSVTAGEITYLARGGVKPPESYKKSEDESPYQWYKFWMECLSPKYGTVAAPPYGSILVPLTLSSPRKIADWLAVIQDRSLAERIQRWVEKNNKRRIGSLILPRDYCASNGVPDVFHDVIDMVKIQLAVTRPHRNILESIGFFPKYEVPIKDHGY